MLKTMLMVICVELIFAYPLLDCMLIVSCVELLFAYTLLNCMTSLIYVLLVMFFLLFSRIKSCGKFLIYSIDDNQILKNDEETWALAKT